MYIYEQKNWPNFSWNSAKISDLLATARFKQGCLLGNLKNLGFQLREEATLNTLTQDVLKTSEIEGERLDDKQVRSSIAKRLGIEVKISLSQNRNVEGIVEILLDATQNYHAPLTQERLLSWHKVLFPTGVSRMQRITAGAWRSKESGPMQVVSGPYGREKIHFEAPSYDKLKKEMGQFIKWFNEPQEMDFIIRSAIAHFWFVTIHPFEDGNGRIARAIADMLLARSEKSTQRFYSMSAQIQHERNNYYDILEISQKGSLDITSWLEWYLNCFIHAVSASEKLLDTILTKAQFWRNHAGEPFNERQHLMINKLLDDFKGKLNSSKWAKISKCSQDTALRDINDLLSREILIKNEAGGRSTSYHLNLNNLFTNS